MLSEKAVELSALSTELERKDALREREAAAQRSKWELERESVSRSENPRIDFALSSFASLNLNSFCSFCESNTRTSRDSFGSSTSARRPKSLLRSKRSGLPTTRVLASRRDANPG